MAIVKWSFFLAALVACSAPPEPRPAAPRAPAPAIPDAGAPSATPAPLAEGSRVLFVVVGYGNPRESISLSELARDYCAGKVPILADLRPLADERFDCAGAITIESLRELVPHGATAIAMTDLDHLTSQWKALAVDGVSFFARPTAYPLVLADGTGARPDFTPRLTHFIMTGVTAITRGTGAMCDAQGIAWLTKNLRPHFQKAKYVHISNEVSFTPDCEYPLKGSFVFCTKEPHFQALLDLRANIVELTGNHNRDFGDEPFLATLAWYRKHGIQTFGGGATPEEAAQPIVVPLADGKRLGLVGFNEICPLKECAKDGGPGANAYSRAKAKAAIEKLRGPLGADFVIATVQWKEHDSEAPTRTQGPMARDLIDLGADLVLGSQAHQLQVIEFYQGKPIYYGLGNLLFDQVHRIGVRQAFFLHHYFFEGRLVQSVPVFTWISDTRQPGLATREQAAEMKAIAFRDELLYEGRSWFHPLVFVWP